MLNGVERGIDLSRIKIDDAQYLWRKSKFPVAREFDECWKFSREMIGGTDDLHFFVDQLSVRMNRHRFGSQPHKSGASQRTEAEKSLAHRFRRADQFECDIDSSSSGCLLDLLDR